MSACSENPQASWGYAGPRGPSHWASLSPQFAACANGKQQSPINIAGYALADLPALSFSFETDKALLRNDGRQVHADFRAGNTSVLDARPHTLQSAHFHSPSEHLVDGGAFSAELHLVHTDARGKLAVVGILFGLGAANPTLQAILDHAPRPGTTVQVPIPLPSAFPTDLSFFRYDGSKTTPPCDEPVDWYVLRHPMSVSQEQVNGLLSLSSGPNNRPTQPLGPRQITLTP